MKTCTLSIFHRPEHQSASYRQLVRGVESGTPIMETDLTYPDFTACGKAGTNDLAVIGVPVYSGRVPKLAAERFKEIKGGCPAVVVAAVISAIREEK